MPAGTALLSAAGTPLESSASNLQTASPRLSPLLFVRDAGGVPLPPTEIVGRLKQWEPALGLKYHAVQWAFTWTWKESDPRRARIQAGEIPADSAYDIIGYIPIDCPVDDIPAYAVTALKHYPRAEVSRLVETVGRYNAVDVAKQQVDTVLNDTLGGGALGQSVSGNSGQVTVATAITATPASTATPAAPAKQTKQARRAAKQAAHANPA